MGHLDGNQSCHCCSNSLSHCAHNFFMSPKTHAQLVPEKSEVLKLRVGRRLQLFRDCLCARYSYHNTHHVK
ncbi:MAG: hypothetical protein MHM6MM_002053 [Cercozoa sp. M6MM]